MWFPHTVVGATSLTLTAAVTGVGENQTYSATVQATGPGPAGPASAPASATTGKTTPPDHGGGGGDHGGDPIAMATGAYSYSHRDLAVVGVVPLDFIAYYSSITPLPSVENPSASDRPLGKRWNHSYNTRIFIPDQPPSKDPFVALIWGGGEISIYDWDNRIGQLTKRGRPNANRLVLNPDLTFTLVRADQTRFDFDASGRMIAIQSNVGNRVVLAYSGGLLRRVTDQGSGRYLSFDYYTSGADAGRIHRVSDNAGPVDFLRIPERRSGALYQYLWRFETLHL